MKRKICKWCGKDITHSLTPESECASRPPKPAKARTTKRRSKP